MRRLSSRIRGRVAVPSRARRATDEGGFSLVEVMVAMVLIAIVFSALAGLLVSALHSARTNELRVKANQVGQQVLEDLRAVPWEDAGFYADDAGYRATYDGHDTVTLGATRPAGETTPTPRATHDVGGITYQTRADVVWVDDASDNATDDDPQDLKRLYVEVTWSNKGQDYSLSVRADRVPTAEEVTPRGAGAVSLYAVQSFSGTPTDVNLDASGYTTAPVTFAVTMSDATSQVRLSWIDRSSTTHTALMSYVGDTTVWTYELPAGAGPFGVGPQAFTIRAHGAADSTADGQTEITMSTSSAGLDLGQPLVVPGSPSITASGALEAPLTVSALATSPVTAMTLTYTNRAGGDVSVPMTLAGGVAGSYTFPAGACCFPDGVSTFTVSASGSGTASRSTDVVFTPPTTPEVAIVDAVLDDNVCTAKSGNPRALMRPVTLTLRVDNVLPSDTVRASFNDSANADHDLAYVSTSGGRSTFRKTFATGSLAWKSNASSVVVSAYAQRGSDVVATSANLTPSPDGIVKVDNQGACP